MRVVLDAVAAPVRFEHCEERTRSKAADDFAEHGRRVIDVDEDPFDTTSGEGRVTKGERLSERVRTSGVAFGRAAAAESSTARARPRSQPPPPSRARPDRDRTRILNPGLHP